MSRKRKQSEIDPDIAEAADMNMAHMIAVSKARAKEREECVFCGLVETKKRFILDTKHLFLMKDAFPVVHDHLLIVSKEHLPGCLDLPDVAWLEIPELIKAGLGMVKLYDPSVESFNLGHNSGIIAGQTVMHCHFHLFPRRKGDVKNPRGGIRNFKKPIVPY